MIGYDRSVQIRVAALFALAVATGAAACASVWGFEDATERSPEGGASSDAEGAPVAVGDVTPSDVPGIMCAPRPPEGWQGPLAIFTGRGNPLPAVPACPDRYDVAIEGKGEPLAPPGACTCACELTSAAPCAGPTVTFYEEDTCTTPCGTANQVVPSRNGSTGCVAWVNGNCPGSKWAKIADAKPGGSCTPEQAGLPVPHSWAAELRLCAAKSDVQATCPAGTLPAPSTGFPYEPNNYCIARRSAGECPPTYPRQRTFFDGSQVKDTRGCKDCVCGPPTGTCGGTVTTVDTPGSCSGGITSHSVPAACSEVKSSNNGFGYDHKDAGGPVSCTPSGGGSDGTFEPISPITVCCRVE